MSKTMCAFVSNEEYKKLSPKKTKTKLSNGYTLCATTTYEVRDKTDKEIDEANIINTDEWFNSIVTEICDEYNLERSDHIGKFYNDLFAKSRRIKTFTDLLKLEQLCWKNGDIMWQNS